VKQEILDRLQPYRQATAVPARELLESWWQAFQVRSEELEFADKPLARKLYGAASTALQRPTENVELLHAAVQYVANTEDEEHDLLSPLGMEDDAEVWNAVCSELGWEDLKV
jgi:hypothetical protein